MVGWLFLTLHSASASPLTIHVEDPAVHTVVLKCGTQRERVPVNQGQATFLTTPDRCEIDLIRAVGSIDKPGVWRCSAGGCVLEDVDHSPVTDASDRINLIFISDTLGNQTVELNCPDGHRQRSTIERNTTVFTSVPNLTCDAKFRGGASLTATGLTAGTWYCQLDPGAARCHQR